MKGTWNRIYYRLTNLVMDAMANSVQIFMEVFHSYKWKGIIYLVVVTLAGLGHSYSVKPWYKSSGLFQIGKIGGVGFIEDPTELTLQLNETHVPLNETRQYMDTYITEVKTPQKSSGVIYLESISTSKEKAVKEIEKVVKPILERHSSLAEWTISNKKLQIDSLAAQIKSTKAQLEFMQRNPPTGQGSTEKKELESYLGSLRETNLMQMLPSLIDKKFALQLEISAVKASESNWLREPSTPSSPHKPSKKAIMSLWWLFGGLSLLLFLILKTELRKTAAPA